MNKETQSPLRGDDFERCWNGDENRTFGLYRPCSCGCDMRDGVPKVGYLSGSDEKGDGFTLIIQDEAVYQRIAKGLRRCSNGMTYIDDDPIE